MKRDAFSTFDPKHDSVGQKRHVVCIDGVAVAWYPNTEYPEAWRHAKKVHGWVETVQLAEDFSGVRT